MKDILTPEDIDDKYSSKVYTQSYEPTTLIEGVKLLPVKSSVGDEGDFSELFRIKTNGEIENIPGFKIAQINRTRLFPHSIKAWHVHFKQDEIWYVPPTFQLFVGLWDLRKESPTCGKTMRINIGQANTVHLLIPKGVAHGSANFSSSQLNLYYFVNQQFNLNDPDEKRINWDTLGKEFWSPEKD